MRPKSESSKPAAAAAAEAVAAEAGEAAAALEAVVALGLGSRGEAHAVIVLLSRLCATLTGLCKKAGG